MLFATVFAAAVAGSAIAAPIKQARDVPATWATGYLEEYDSYHLRYIALSCQDQHNTTFFDDCCHPLLATETLSDRPSNCTPNTTEISSASSRIAADATATVSSAYASASDNSTTDAEAEYCSAATSATAAYTTPLTTVSSTPASTESYTPTSTSSPAYTPSSTSTSTYAAATSSAANVDANVDFAHHQTSTTSTSKYVAPTSSSTSSEAATSTSSASGTVESGGYATYFYQGGNAGACGTVHSDSDYIIAIDKSWWPNYESGTVSSYCGQSITITNTDNGKTVTATVADVCPTCDTDNSLDLSVGAFTAIADESAGEVPITWYFS